LTPQNISLFNTIVQIISNIQEQNRASRFYWKKSWIERK